VENGLRVNKVILFGSQARGTANMDSDIDILVVSEDFRNKGIFGRAKLTKDAEIRTIRKFLVPLDILTMTPEEYESKASIIAEHAKKGRVVYAA